MNADGSGQHPITNGASWYGTAWSPDGSRIVTLDFPSRTVYTLNAADGSDAQAVHPGGPPVRPRLAAARHRRRGRPGRSRGLGDRPYLGIAH